MDSRISLVTLGVADIARARRFYEALGWQASGASSADVVFFHTGGAVLGLWSRTALAEDAGLPSVAEESGRFGGIALAHNVPSRAEVDAILAEAERAGGRILTPAHDAFWGGYSGYFADPDGHPWEVAWNPHFPLDEDGALRLPL